MAYEQVPDELKQLPRWGLFHKEWVPARNRYTKIPIDPRTGEGGKSNDESTWSDFETAVTAMAANDNADGLAFYFKPPYIGIDIDHVQTEIEAYAEGDHDSIVGDFMDHTMSYAETSLSGEGVHIIVKGTMPGDRRRHDNVEIYPDGRFFALTGNAFGAHTSTVAEVAPADLQHLYTQYVEPPQPLKPVMEPHEFEGVNDLDEQEIVDRMLASSKGTQIRRLLEGDWTGYDSQSEADLALADELAFWAAKDYAKMDTIFRASGLMRPKYEEKHGKATYGFALLNKAISDTANSYIPKQSDDFMVMVPGLTAPENPKQIKWRSYDDTGLAQRFVDANGTVVRYDAKNKQFMYFNGTNWEYDERLMVDQLLNKTVDDLQHEEPHTPDGASDDDAEAAEKALAKFQKHSKSNAGKTAATNEIKKLVAVVPDDFDTHLGILNTPSGYIDLANGELHDAKAADYFTKVTESEYSPTADCPQWMKFLREVLVGDQELIDFVQRVAGYSLLGTNEQSIMVIIHGVGGKSNGSNGKSVFVETLRTILGSYAVTISPDTLMAKRFGMDTAALADIAKMRGTRFVATSETESGQRLAESLVKRMTGGEQLTGKNLYAQPFTFTPSHVVWMSTNHQPIVNGSDEGIWRRLIFIPFTAVIPPERRDPMLKQKLLTESAGILNWAVEGALKYQEDHKLDIPEIVKAQNSTYRDQMDTVGAFLEEVAVMGPSYRATSADVLKAFEVWEHTNGTGMSKAALNRELGTRFGRYKTMGIRGFKGFKIRDDVQKCDSTFNF